MSFSCYYSNNSKCIDIKVEISSKHNSIDILLMVIKSAVFVWHFGQHAQLNTTCGFGFEFGYSVWKLPVANRSNYYSQQQY